jgi:hypothetical protein
LGLDTVATHIGSDGPPVADKKDRGVIHIIDRRTGEEIAPDPHGDGTVSVDW